jgi:hypothetical protein
MAGELPVGFDRADGVSGRIGTATPAGSILYQTSSGAMTIDDVTIEELPDSPDIERAEQATISKTYRMSWTECLNRIAFIGRGTYAEDSFGNGYLVLSCSIKHEPGGTGLMTIVMEAKTFDSPPDEFSIVPVELGVNIIKHPRYFYAFLGTGYGSTEELQNQMVIRLLQDYFENTNANYRNAIITMLTDSAGVPTGVGDQPPHWNSDTGAYDDGSLVSGTAIAKAAAIEIIQKWWRGEETPYVVGYEMTFSQYYFVSPFLNPGGYIEDPMTESYPQLPEYFYSRDFPPNAANTIFDYMPAINPQCYSDDGTSLGSVNISWLRKADQVEYQRTWFKKTMTWLGSPVGQWDIDLYTNGPRPSAAGDYRTTS